MTSEIKEISATEREIHLQIEPAILKDAYAKVSKRYADRASVPGFRKGYAPLDVIRLRFKEEIKNEVLQLVLPDQVNNAILEHGLNPLTEPHLHVDDVENVKVNGSEPVSIHVHVEVMPEIETPDYKGIKLDRMVKPVDESEIDSLINDRLQREAALIPVEGRAAENGDTVVVDLEGTFEGEASGEPISANDLEIKLGDDAIESSFTDNLIGVSEDEEKDFTVSYAEDFSSEALRGKTVNYKAKVKTVGRMETPELNDDWAKSLDEGYDSLKELRKRLKADLERVAEADADSRVKNEAIANLIEDAKFEVPNALIENQARNLLNNFAQDMGQRGIDINKVEKEFLQMAYQNMRQQAERDVKGALLLDKIAEAEKIEVSDAEVDEELGKMAEYYRVTPEEIVESFRGNDAARANISNNLKTRKSIDVIVDKAKVTEKPWTVEEPKAPEEESGASKVEEKKPAKKKAPTKKAVKKEKE